MSTRENDININVRAPGAEDTKKQIDKVSESISGVAPKVEQASGAFSTFIGLLSSLGILASLATASKKISEFFDNLKTKADEAVKKAQEVRQAYDNLFEAFGAYDEGSRKEVVKSTERLLMDTGTSKEVGYPTIEAYRRQFKDTMSPADYDSGMKNALSYVTRHGGAATPELIQMMRGWGMNTSQQQSDMYLSIMGASGQSGLTDEEMVDLLGRTSPNARKLGWTPQHTLSVLATLATGEIGRNKTTRPAQIVEEYATDPKKALKEYPALNNIKPVIPVSASDDKKEDADFQGTLEAIQNKTDAGGRLINSEQKPASFYRAKIRELGSDFKEQFRKKHPFQQGLINLTKFGNEEDEWAAYMAWKGSLSKEERQKISARVHNYRNQKGQSEMMRFSGFTEQQYWFEIMNPKERYEALTKAAGKTQNPQYSGEYFFDELVDPNRKDFRLYPSNSNGGNTVPAQNSVFNQTYNNNTYIEQTPPDAQMRSRGGLH
jgi:hypothetical protein